MADKAAVDPKTYTTEYIKSDYETLSFLGNPHVDALSKALQILAAEVWISRKRLHVIESLMDKNIPVTRASIQAYMPSPEEQQAWKADRDTMIEAVNAPFMVIDETPFPSVEAFSYDPHKQPSVATRPRVKVGEVPAPTVPTTYAGPKQW